MMTTLVGQQRAVAPEPFNALFKLRYDIFVQRRQWAIATRNGLDIDEYDTPQAVYFCEYGDKGRVESHVRLNPSDRQSLLADVFPHLVEVGSARGAKIWEATRYIVQPSRWTKTRANAARARLMISMLKWAQQHGASHVQAVIETEMLQHFVEMTEQTRPLGLSHPYGGGPGVPGGGDCMAIRWPATDRVIADIARFGKLAASAHAGNEAQSIIH